MANAELKIEVKIAWWVRPYLYFVKIRSRIQRKMPDFDKVEAVLRRGCKPGIGE
jgi:hypothetical protein